MIKVFSRRSDRGKARPTIVLHNVSSRKAVVNNCLHIIDRGKLIEAEHG
jgi:hypothetical protein